MNATPETRARAAWARRPGALTLTCGALLAALWPPSAVAAPPAAPTLTAPAPALVASPPRAAAAPADPPWAGLSRIFLTFRPYVGISRVGFEESGPVLGGFVSEVGAEVITRFGLVVGAQVSPFTLAKRPTYTGLSTDAYLFLGYAQPFLGIQVGLGSGVAGAIRVGRFDRTHAELRMAWAMVLPLTLPQELHLNLVIRAAPRLFAHLDVGGGYGSMISFYGTGGVQYLLTGDGLGRTTLLAAGVGLSWIEFYLGPMLTLSAERRF